MLKVLILAGVIAGFAFSFGFVGLSAWRSLHQQEHSSHESSGKKAAEKGGNTASNVFAEEKAEDAIARYNLWLMIFTGVLAFVALLQIGFLIRADEISNRNAKAAQQSADVARDTLIASQRPWIVAEPVITELGFQDDEQFGASVKTTITNIGGSLAKNVSIHVSLLPSDTGGIRPAKDGKWEAGDVVAAQKELCLRSAKEEAQAKIPVLTRLSLFPKQTASQTNAVFLVGNDLKTARRPISMTEDGIDPVIIGCVTYQWALNKEQRFSTQFAFVIEMKEGKPSIPMGSKLTAAQVHLSRALTGKNDAD